MRRRTTRLGDGNGPERGSATVVTLAGVGVLLMVCLGGVALGSAVAAMHRARAAADLGALAAAASLARGNSQADACASGHRVVRANGASPEACRTTSGGSVTVAAVAPAGLRLPGFRWSARALARAGPAP